MPKPPVVKGNGVPAIVYDLEEVSHFFRSVALAIATQRTTSMEWKTYDESTILNVTYGLLFWKEPPGYSEVQTGTKAEIERIADSLHDQYLNAWLQHLHTKGPARANEYVNTMQKLRESAKDAVQWHFKASGKINDEVIGRVNEGIKDLARIKLASAVGVAALGAVGFIVVGAGGAAITVGAASLEIGATGVYGLIGASAFNTIGCSLAKNWEDGPNTAAVGIDAGIKGSKVVAARGTGAMVSRQMEKYAAQATKSEKVIRSMQGQIGAQMKKLGREGVKPSRQKIYREVIKKSEQRIADETAKRATAETMKTGTKVVARSIPIVFAAWDIFNAVGEYNETVDGLR